MESFVLAILSTLPDLPAFILASTGFYFAYRIIKFPDITVDGSFVVGGVGAATMSIYFESSTLGLLFSILLGGFAGSLTSMLYLINPKPAYKMLSGIFVVLGLYSLNFRLLERKNEVTFNLNNSFMNMLSEWDVQSGFQYRFIFGIVIVLLINVGLWFLLKSKIGLILRTVGGRPKLDGLKPSMYIWLGIVISNCIVAIGGWFYSSVNGFTQVTILSTIIHALAISIIGELILGAIPSMKDKSMSPITILLTPIVGSIIYLFVKAIVNFIIVDTKSETVSINQQDVNAIVALTLVILIFVSQVYSRYHQRYGSDAYDSVTSIGEI